LALDMKYVDLPFLLAEADIVSLAAALSTQPAWHQPILRLVDTLVGIAVGVLFKWLASYAFYRTIGEPVR